MERQRYLIFSILQAVFFFVGCNVLINPTPSINVRQNEINIPIGGVFDIGQVRVGGASSEVIFTIENIGKSKLFLLAEPELINISGNTSIFELSADSVVDTLNSGISTEFSIIYKPSTMGLKSTKISIYSTDLDKPLYIFIITGVGVSPEINVKHNSTDIPNSIGAIDFGEVFKENPNKTEKFFIENLGTQNLRLTGTPKLIEISGLYASEFSVNESVTDNLVLPEKSTTFEITFAPTQSGYFTALVSILNSDDDENPFTFTVIGRYSVSGDLNGDGIADFAVGAHGFDNNTNDTGCVYLFWGKSSYPKELDADKADVKIVGINTNDRIGYFTSCTNDINGDSITDLIIGLIYDDSKGIQTGAIYIFWGRSNWQSEISISDSNVKIVGESMGGQFGRYISTSGDINNDGFPDIVVGASMFDYSKGKTYVFFGRSNWNSSIEAMDADVKIETNIMGDFLGTSVTIVGDVNNDKIDDLFVGAEQAFDDKGCGYLFFGKNTWNQQISSSSADVIITGENVLDFFATSCASGDINNDGIHDIVVGAPGQTLSEKEGTAYVFYGRENWLNEYNASNADVIIIGEEVHDKFGWHLEFVDINNDGFDDCIIGAIQNHFNSGKTYVLLGKSKLANNINAYNLDVIINGFGIYVYFGYSISKLNDINNDGYMDFIISAPLFDSYGNDKGEVYIYYGQDNWNSNLSVFDADVTILGEHEGDIFGICVAGGK